MHILVKNEVPFKLRPENLSKAEAKDNGLIFTWHRKFHAGAVRW